MYKIVKKKSLNPTVTLMEIDAPLIAKKAEPGQFIILRVDENGERIPLTVAGYDREAGTVLSSRLSVQQQKSSITLTKAIIFTIL